MAKESTMAAIVDTGSLPVTIGANDINAQQSGLAAHGRALAATIIAQCQSEASNWTRFYRDLCALEEFGRKAFQQELKASVFVSKDDTDKNVGWVKGARSSAKVRISEFNTIAKAIDKGMRADPTLAYHAAVGMAREHLADLGEGSTRGRKAKTWQEKLEAFIKQNVPPAELSAALQIVQAAAASGDNAAPF